jgi:hypothetical protein
MNLYISIEFIYGLEGTLLVQWNYVSKILCKFEMQDCQLAATPMNENIWLWAYMNLEAMDVMSYQQFKGNLIFLTHTHSNITYLVNVISIFMNNLHEVHLNATKHILWYVKGTLKLGHSSLMKTRPPWQDGWMRIGHVILMIDNPPHGCFSNLDTTHYLGPINFNYYINV